MKNVTVAQNLFDQAVTSLAMQDAPGHGMDHRDRNLISAIAGLTLAPEHLVRRAVVEGAMCKRIKDLTSAARHYAAFDCGVSEQDVGVLLANVKTPNYVLMTRFLDHAMSEWPRYCADNGLDSNGNEIK